MNYKKKGTFALETINLFKLIMKKLIVLAFATMLCIACSTEEETTASEDTNLDIVLENYKGEIVIWTDVKDVIFQKDPTDWIEQNKTKPILAFSECITFKHDEWAVTNAGTSFPMEWEWLQDKTSYCAGTIVGDSEYLRDLFIDIYR